MSGLRKRAAEKEFSACSGRKAETFSLLRYDRMILYRIKLIILSASGYRETTEISGKRLPDEIPLRLL
ncbi:MAG: hypothetical protein B6245_14725 [Desulfobacteraceae bacterium 4572_88]|nr:MAG: hypothetical protein B6245_14725 [Desulfobacteraceae bacterium 4572_88]